MKNKEPIMSSAFGLCVFYAIVLSGIDHTLITSSVNRLPMLFFVFLGVIAGCTVGGVLIFGKQQLLREAIQPSEYMGMKASLGAVPIHAYEPETAKSPFDPKRVRDFPHIRVAEKPELRDFMQVYMDTYRDSHPGHVALMQKMLDIFEYYNYLPATHVKGGHGGQSLQEHSLLVSHVMAVQKRTFSYKGAKRGKQVLMALKDDKYVFNPNDPMVELLGLAHDIGKIECFEFAKGDKLRREPIDLRKDHDLTGARVLARMPEIWGLPDEDRSLLLTIIAHYHHPSDTPMLTPTTPISDRLHALLELLIYSDRATGAIEAGEVRSAPEAFMMIAKGETYLEDYREEADSIWEAVLAVINAPHRFNDRDKTSNIGVKVFSPHYRTYLLLCREDYFMACVAGEMGLTTFANEMIYRGTKRTHEFTARVLRVLQSKDALLTDHDPVERDVKGRLYRVNFYDNKVFFADKEETIPKTKEELPKQLVKFSFGSTIILKCDPNFRGTLLIPEPKISALILHSRFGSMGIRKIKPATSSEGAGLDDDFAADENDIDNDIDNEGDYEGEGAQSFFDGDSVAEKPLAEIEAETVASRQEMTVMLDGTLVAGEPVGPIKKLPPLPAEVLREFDLGREQFAERKRDKKAEEQRAKQALQPPSQKLIDLQKKLNAWANTSMFPVDKETYGPNITVFLTEPVELLKRIGNGMPQKTFDNACEGKLTYSGIDVHKDKASGKEYLMVARFGKQSLLPNYIAPAPGSDEERKQIEAQTEAMNNPEVTPDATESDDGNAGFVTQNRDETDPVTNSLAAASSEQSGTFGSVDMSFFDSSDASEPTNPEAPKDVEAPWNDGHSADESGSQTASNAFGLNEPTAIDTTLSAYPLPSKSTASALAFASVEDQVQAEGDGPALVGGTFFDDPSPEVVANTGPLGRRLYNALEAANSKGLIQMVVLADLPLLICKDSGVKPLLDIEWANPELTFDKIVSGKLEEDGVIVYVNANNQKQYVALKKK